MSINFQAHPPIRGLLLGRPRLGTFHAAAKRLGVTQPSITARIKELELDAGSPLFERVGRNVALTERGSTLFDQTKRILTLISDLDGRMSNAGPLRGLLRFGAPDSFALLCLADFLKAVNAKHPELNVASTVDNSNALAVKLSEGSPDVAVINQSAVPKHFRTQLIGFQRLIWVRKPCAERSQAPARPGGGRAPSDHDQPFSFTELQYFGGLVSRAGRRAAAIEYMQ